MGLSTSDASALFARCESKKYKCQLILCTARNIGLSDLLSASKMKACVRHRFWPLQRINSDAVYVSYSDFVKLGAFQYGFAVLETHNPQRFLPIRIEPSDRLNEAVTWSVMNKVKRPFDVTMYIDPRHEIPQNTELQFFLRNSTQFHVWKWVIISPENDTEVACDHFPSDLCMIFCGEFSHRNFKL